jgi:3-oxoacyl-[acyl-carrier protein] reductase
MAKRNEIIEIIYKGIEDLNQQNDTNIIKSVNTKLFGSESGLDSLGLVNLISSIEEGIEELTGKYVPIANSMTDSDQIKPVMLITGTSKGIGNYLANYYLNKGFFVIGCSRGESDISLPNYRHYCLDVVDESQVNTLFRDLKKDFGRLNVLINNAGIASYNHSLLTSIPSVKRIFDTNVIGMFLFCREAAKLMKKNSSGRIINISTVLVPLKLEGEAIYAATKASVNTLTEILSREFVDFGITVNAVGPTPIMTDLIKDLPEEKIKKLLARIPMRRLGVFEDVVNVINFFIQPESNFISGQIIYLGGV